MLRAVWTTGGGSLKARCLAAALALICTGTAAIAADTISATHVFPASLIYSRSFLEYVKKANEAGKGVFTIQVRGGPEAIGMMEQPGAVRSGVVDMVYSPVRVLRRGGARVRRGQREHGRWPDGAQERRHGTPQPDPPEAQRHVLLGWVDSGIRFNLWSTKEPKLDSRPHRHQGLQGARQPDLQRVPDELSRRAGDQPASTELYTALERGTVDITAWTQIGSWT